MEREELADRVTDAVESLPDRVTHAVGGLRDRAAGVVESDGGSVFRELSGVTRRLGASEKQLINRIDEVEDSLSKQLRAIAGTQKRTGWPRRLFWMLIGAGVGVAVEYLADPDRGHARRTQLGDQAAARARGVGDELQKQAKLTLDRARGEAIEAVKDQLPEDVPDDPRVLEQRIKSEVFGHRDDVQDVVLKIDGPGTVAVKGTVPTPASQRELLEQVADVEGVIDVRSELSVRGA